MVLTGNRAKRFLSVSHTTKTIHRQLGLKWVTNIFVGPLSRKIVVMTSPFIQLSKNVLIIFCSPIGGVFMRN